MKSVAAILLGLCLTHLRHVDAEVKVLRKSIVGLDKLLVYPSQHLLDKHFSYGLCENDPEASQLKCTVIREKTPYGNDIYSCDVTIKRYHDVDNYPSITLFSSDNYVAINLFDIYHGETYVNFTTVQWKSCKVGEAFIDPKMQLLMPDADFAIVGHKDSYDVILRNDDLVSRASKSKKITIGADGHIIDGPSPSAVSLSTSDNMRSSIVSLNDGSSGYFQIKTNDDQKYVQVLVKPDGTEKILATYPKTLSPPLLSTKNNLVSACYQTDSEYKCTQYDYDGNLKLQITIPRSFKLNLLDPVSLRFNQSGIQLFRSYNLPNGGFYLLSGQCPNGQSECKQNYLQFYIERIDANGTNTGSIKFQGFDYNDATSWIFYENGTNGTCLSVLLRSTFDENEHIDRIANCFTDADFTK